MNEVVATSSMEDRQIYNSLIQRIVNTDIEDYEDVFETVDFTYFLHDIREIVFDLYGKGSNTRITDFRSFIEKNKEQAAEVLRELGYIVIGN